MPTPGLTDARVWSAQFAFAAGSMACYYHVRKGALKRGHRGDNDDEEEEEQTDIDGEIQELFDGTRSTHRQRERVCVCVW
jgi:hypothetical protein